MKDWLHFLVCWWTCGHLNSLYTFIVLFKGTNIIGHWRAAPRNYFGVAYKEYCDMQVVVRIVVSSFRFCNAFSGEFLCPSATGCRISSSGSDSCGRIPSLWVGCSSCPSVCDFGAALGRRVRFLWSPLSAIDLRTGFLSVSCIILAGGPAPKSVCSAACQSRWAHTQRN